MVRLIENNFVQKVFTTKFEQEILRSAYSRFNDLHDPFRCNLFALLIRENVRVMLERLAPDNLVSQTEWCKNDDNSQYTYDRKDNKYKITQVARLRFSLTGVIGNQVIDEHEELDVLDDCKLLRTEINNLSKFTHIANETYKLSSDKAKYFIENVENALIIFCERYSEIKESINEKVTLIVQDILSEEIMDDYPEDVVCLSSGTVIDEYIVEKLEPFSCYDNTVDIQGCSSVGVTLEYGGGESKDGLTTSESFPSSFSVSFDMTKFEVINIDYDIVNTASFYGDDDDDEFGDSFNS